jgi:DNA-directed RNA polymerase subunit M/transcription elongation factor TFIIS
MSFDFKKFTKELYEEYNESLSKEEIDDLLNLHDEYSKDTPVSTGKRLIINNVRIVGEKESSLNQDYSGARIDFSIPFRTGINMLIADNLKGKSSIFKVIKYALTGSNSLKPNIKKWIHYTFINFSISERKYTAYLDLTKRSLSAYLLNGFINSIEDLETYSQDIIFEANSESSYQDQMNDFFFNQFTYYSLKWTQKSSIKDSNELLEVGASWRTYFKSILLESRDSNQLMYGSQGKKVFQMLLGIELTYPINRLSIKKDILNDEKAKEQSYSERQRKQAENNLLKLQNRLKEIDIELANIQTTSKEKVNLAPIYKEYNETLARINSENKKAQKIAIDSQGKNKELNTLKQKQDRNQSEIYRLNKELENSIKQRNNFKEYVEIGVLFSNLDIKHCPSCNHDVTESQKKVRLQEHKCSLCGDSIENDNSEIDTEVYDEKIANLELTIKSIEKEIEKLVSQNLTLQESYKTCYDDIVSLGQMEDSIVDLSSLSSRLQKLEEIINSAKTEIVPDDSIKEKLIAEKAVIQFQINELSTQKPKIVTDYEIKIRLLNSAIEKLSSERLSIGERVINRLSKLMTDEIQDLGLNSITEVQIDDNFEIQYKQDNDFITFDNIAEGEQLRAKIAFYLSLIQLDIEFNFGRHTRLLIIDSPGKEEADSKYLEGLSQVLNSIESRYSDNLQILIGTAERQLSGILENQIEIPVGEYVF